VRDTKRLRRVLDGIVIIAALAALWGLGQFLTGYGDLQQRIRGPFSHYMTFAGVLLLANLVLIARFACRKPSLRDWRWVASAVITIALLASLTRSSWIALGVALFVLALLRRPKSVLVWMPVALVGLALLVAPVRERIVSIVDLQDRSNYDRLSMLDAGLEMVTERPLLGLGPGMPERLYPIYRPLAAPRHTVPHLHNTYIQIAAEGGLIGLGAYLWLIGTALVAAHRGYRRWVDKSDRGAAKCFEELYLGSFLAVIGFSLAGLFEANWLDTEVQRILLLLLAIPFVLKVQEDGIDRGVGQWAR
jgi:O-antigen ligase